MVMPIEEYDELTQDVIHFVSQERDIRPDSLYPEMRISHDLHADGDDAYDLILNFCERYNVDYSDFAYDQYFGSESGGCLFFLLPVILIYWIITRKTPKFMKKIPLTIQDLVDSARTKKLHSLATEPE